MRERGNERDLFVVMIENNPHYSYSTYFKGCSQRPFSKSHWLNINNAVLHTYFMRGAARLNVIAHIQKHLCNNKIFLKTPTIYFLYRNLFFFLRNSLSEYFEKKLFFLNALHACHWCTSKIQITIRICCWCLFVVDQHDFWFRSNHLNWNKYQMCV